MKKINKSTLYILLTLMASLYLSACTGADVPVEAPSEAVCTAIVDAKCVKCHYKTRICDALGTKSVRKWQKTIDFMIKQGAVLTADEQNKVVACLSSLPRGSDVVCR